MKKIGFIIMYIISLFSIATIFAQSPNKGSNVKILKFFHSQQDSKMIVVQEAAKDNVNLNFNNEGQDSVVVFNDSNLEQAVRDALNKPTGPITDVDMATLTNLVASDKNISDLTGLQYAVNLFRLILGKNQISDITALQNLTSLNWLSLNNNQISDITALQGLASLNRLILAPDFFAKDKA